VKDGNVIWGLDDDAKPPPIALDPAGKRFAIANNDTVILIVFDQNVLGSE
jgi:hypothetical protein